MKIIKIILVLFVAGFLFACESQPQGQYSKQVPQTTVGSVRVESISDWVTPNAYSDVLISVLQDMKTGKRFMILQRSGGSNLTVVPLSENINTTILAEE